MYIKTLKYLLVVYLFSGCTSTTLNPNVLHDFTKIISSQGSQAVIQASNAARHPAHLKPFLLKRAGEYANAQNAKTVRILNAEAWFAGGPSEVWRSVATIQVIKEELPEISSVQYSTSKLLRNELFSASSTSTTPTSSLRGAKETEEDGTSQIVFPTFIDTIDTEGGFWGLADAIIKVEPGSHRFLVDITRRKNGVFGGFTKHSALMTAEFEPNKLYQLRSKMQDGKLNIWIEEASKPNIRMSQIQVAVN